MTRYALPGMMAPDTPRFNRRSVVGPVEGVELLILREPGDLPEVEVEWWANLQGFGRYLIKQTGAENVFTRDVGLEREYWFQTGPDVWPPGTHEFEFHIRGNTVRRWITQKPSFKGLSRVDEWIQRFTEVTGGPVVSGGLLLYNPETGLTYSLGVSGSLGTEQITLEPEG